MSNNKKIETPEKMWELFCEYRTELKSNPFMVHDFVGAAAKDVERRKERPLTLNGFECWLYEKKIIADIGGYFSNEKGYYVDYIDVCAIIKKIIKTDQIEGGMCKIYDGAITARLNGLSDTINNINHNMEITMDLGEKKLNEDKL